MRTSPLTSRPAATLWCLLALLASTLLPGIHSLRPHTHPAPSHPAPSHAGPAHTCGCSHEQERRPPADDRVPVPEDEDDDCPVCEAIRTVAIGTLILPPLAVLAADAPSLSLAIRGAAPPAQRITPPQRTPRGPPIA